MKEKFLNELKRWLKDLDQQEQDEIISFYEERFNVGMRLEGKTETDIIDELESPKVIASNVLNAYGQEGSKKSTVKKAKTPWAIIWILLFDVFILPIIFSGFFGVLFGILAAWFGLLVSFTLSLVSINIALNFFINLAFALGIWILLFYFILWVYDVFVGFILWIVKWHIEVFEVQKGDRLINGIQRFRIRSLFRGFKKVSFINPMLKTIALLLVVFGGVGIFMVEGQNLFQGDTEKVYYEETHETSTDLETWTITTNLDDGDVYVKTHDEDYIFASMKHSDRGEGSLVIDETNQTIEVINEMPRFSFTFIWDLFGESDEVIIYLPETIYLEHLDIKTSNGTIELERLNGDSIDLESKNGSFILKALNFSESLEGTTSNGRIEIHDTLIPFVDLRTSNGRIQLNGLEVNEGSFITSNGRINVENINSATDVSETLFFRTSNGSVNISDVYANDIELRTSNGNIDYFNEDLSFSPSRLVTNTSNGTINKNVVEK